MNRPPFDERWLSLVLEQCFPVFERANVGFTHQVVFDENDGDIVKSVLWEADPTLFATRYPDSGIIEAYGAENWADVTCIDYWLYLNPEDGTGRVSVEGWNFDDTTLQLSGDDHDAALLANTFASILDRAEGGIAT